MAAPAPASAYGERQRPLPGRAPRPVAPANEVVEQAPADSEGLAVRYRDAAPLARFRGEASYYSDALAGNSTASGEPYRPAALTAAHRSLPFASVVRVVREDTGQAVVVRINDRGPFVRGRVIDLSRAAAETLDLLRRGVVRVRVEVLEYGPKSKKKRRRTR